MKNLKNLFLKLREQLEEKILKLYDDAEQAIVMEWGIFETMTVCQYFPEKGFGFARSTNGKKYFFHITDDVEYDRKDKKILMIGQKIFSYEIKAHEKGLKIIRWSENNSFIDKKMNEFKKNFRIDEAVIRDISQEFFFKKLSDQEILEIGPVSASLRVVVLKNGMQIEVETKFTFHINLYGDETTQDLFIGMSYKDHVRKIRIQTPAPFMTRFGGVTFFIESLEDYIRIQKSIPKEGLHGYVIGGGEPKQNPVENQPKAEYFKLEKENAWSISLDDWQYAILSHPETTVLLAEAIPSVGQITITNPILERFGLYKNRNAYIFCPCTLENQKYTTPFFSFSGDTEKIKKIMEILLPVLRLYLQDKWTEMYTQKLKEEPEEFFIKKKKYIFSGNLSGEYYFLDENPLGENSFPSEEIKCFVKQHNCSFLKEEDVVIAAQEVLRFKREDLIKKIREKNHCISGEITCFREYFEGRTYGGRSEIFLGVSPTSLHLRIPAGRERVCRVISSSFGEGRIKKFTLKEEMDEKTAKIFFGGHGRNVKRANLKSEGLVDTFTRQILAEEMSGVLLGSFTKDWYHYDRSTGRASGVCTVNSQEINQKTGIFEFSFSDILNEFGKNQKEESELFQKIFTKLEEHNVLEELLLSDTALADQILIDPDKSKFVF